MLDRIEGSTTVAQAPTRKKPSRLAAYRRKVLGRAGDPTEARLDISSKLIVRYGANLVSRHRRLLARILDNADAAISRRRTAVVLRDLSGSLFDLNGSVARRLEAVRPADQRIAHSLLARLTELRADIEATANGLDPKGKRS